MDEKLSSKLRRAAAMELLYAALRIKICESFYFQFQFSSAIV